MGVIRAVIGQAFINRSIRGRHCIIRRRIHFLGTGTAFAAVPGAHGLSRFIDIAVEFGFRLLQIFGQRLHRRLDAVFGVLQVLFHFFLGQFQLQFRLHRVPLRQRLLYAVVAVLAVFLVLLPFANPLYAWLAVPLKETLPPGSQLVAIEVASTFFVPMKLAFFAALFIAAPYILYQIWTFVAPALYDREKNLARPLLFAAPLLFYLGCTFTYFALLPVMFAYLNSTAPEGVAMMTDIGKYLDFVLVLLLAGGVSFEVPIAVLVAVLLGWVKVEQLVEWRGYVIVAIFIIAAIITPPDGLSQIMLALPMWGLYEVGIVASRMLLKARARNAPVPSAE